MKRKEKLSPVFAIISNFPQFFIELTFFTTQGLSLHEALSLQSR